MRKAVGEEQEGIKGQFQGLVRWSVWVSIWIQWYRIRR